MYGKELELEHWQVYQFRLWIGLSLLVPRSFSGRDKDKIVEDNRVGGSGECKNYYSTSLTTTYILFKIL